MNKAKIEDCIRIIKLEAMKTQSNHRLILNNCNEILKELSIKFSTSSEEKSHNKAV
jgi:hypothetical protein